MDADAPKDKAQGEHDRCDHEKEQAQRQPSAVPAQNEGTWGTAPSAERDFEGGFGGQEDLEDRYATTCGEH